VNIEKYRELDGAVEYLPHAYRPSVHYPRPVGEPRDPEVMSDFSFIGTGFKSRVEFFESMDFTGIDALLGGAWLDLPETSPLNEYLAHGTEQCVDNGTTARIYRSSKVGINMYRREFEDETPEQDGWAMGPREVEMAACGLPFLRDPRPEGDGVFPFLPKYATAAEAGEQLRWYLAHEEQREKAGQRAREAILDRTFTNHARRLLSLLGS
jgi:hypothetical protein